MEKLKEILLIEDSEATNFMHKRILKRMNVSDLITIRLNGKAAINYLRRKKKLDKRYPEIIFLDFKMPVMSGLDFLKEFKKDSSLNQPKPKIIMLTSSDIQEDIKNPNDLGIDMFLTKILTEEDVEIALKLINKN